jgi:hypothetical protein
MLFKYIAMNKILFLFLGFFLSSTLLNAQEKAKYEKIYYKEVQFENEIVKVVIDNIVSLPKETKFRISIVNKSNEYLIYNAEESNFVIAGQDVRAKDKSFIIEPNSSKKKVFRAFGDGLNAITKFNFMCEGFYSVKMQNPLIAERFKLPASKNNFKVGNFDVTMASVFKETNRTDVKFNVVYNGNNIGFVFPASAAVTMPDGNSYASAKSKDDAILLKKGEKESFTATWERMVGGKLNDMQLVEMWVTFENVFSEGIQTRFAGATLEIVWDEALTEGKK